MRRVAVAWVVLAIAVLLSGCGRQHGPAEEVRPVQTVVAEPGTNALGATYAGVIEARNQSSQGFRVTGAVLKRIVEVGDHVALDQPLLQLDPTSLDLNRQAAKAQLDAARSKAAQAKVNLQRDAELLKQNFISQAEYDRDKVDLDTSVSQQQMAQAQYDEATDQAGYGTLRAAVPGIVTAINVDVGQVINAGATAVTIARDGDREVVINVPESRVNQWREAKDLSVTLWADPGRSYRAHLRRINPDADSATRTYDAYVTILDPDSAVLLGMTATVQLPRIDAGSTYALPLTAIVEKPDGAFVWLVARGNSTVSLHPVKVLTIRGNVALIESGLKDGDVVVTAGANLLHPDQKVRPVGTYGSRDS